MGERKQRPPVTSQRADKPAHMFGGCANSDYSTSAPQSVHQDAQLVNPEEESEWIIEGLLRRGEILVVNIYDLEDGEC